MLITSPRGPVPLMRRRQRRRAPPPTGGHTSGNNPIAGDFAGKDAVFGNLAQLAELPAGTFGQEIHDMLANDEHGVVMVEAWCEQPHPYRARASTSGT